MSKLIDGREERMVSVDSHVRSWAAGVLDTGLRVVVDRSFHPRAMRLRAYVRGPRGTLEAFHDEVGYGRMARVGGRWRLELRGEELNEAWFRLGPVMRGGGRELLRLAASWNALPAARGEALETVVRERARLYDELSRVRAFDNASDIETGDEDNSKKGEVNA